MYVLLCDMIEMLFHGQSPVNLSTDHLFINLGCLIFEFQNM